MARRGCGARPRPRCRRTTPQRTARYVRWGRALERRCVRAWFWRALGTDARASACEDDDGRIGVQNPRVGFRKNTCALTHVKRLNIRVESPSLLLFLHIACIKYIHIRHITRNIRIRSPHVRRFVFVGAQRKQIVFAVDGVVTRPHRVALGRDARIYTFPFIGARPRRGVGTTVRVELGSSGHLVVDTCI